MGHDVVPALIPKGQYDWDPLLVVEVLWGGSHRISRHSVMLQNDSTEYIFQSVSVVFLCQAVLVGSIEGSIILNDILLVILQQPQGCAVSYIVILWARQWSMSVVYLSILIVGSRCFLLVVIYLIAQQSVLPRVSLLLCWCSSVACCCLCVGHRVGYLQLIYMLYGIRSRLEISITKCFERRWA